MKQSQLKSEDNIRMMSTELRKITAKNPYKNCLIST